MLNLMEKFINLKKVSLNFLQSGHSMMTANSVHSVTEAAVKKKTIYALSEWYTVIGNARYQPFPYEVIAMHFEDFRDWKDVASSLNFKISVPGIVPKGKKQQYTDLKITTVRKTIFEKKTDQFTVVLDSSPDPITVNVICKKNASIVKQNYWNHEIIKEPRQAYTARLPISTKKYKYLLDCYL